MSYFYCLDFGKTAAFCLNRKNMIKDLTVGPPGKALRNFSLPLLGGVIFQQMYNVADSLIAGKMIGEDALSAVGNAYEVTLIYLAFAFGCNIGCSVVISQLYGAKRIRELKSAVSTNFLFSGALTLLLMVLGFLLMPSLLRIIRLADSIRPAALEYLNIYTAGLLFLFFYNISSGIFSALGDSKTPFWFLACSSTANVFMDILFVRLFPHRGVGAVAWATFLCQGVSCVLAVVTVFRKLRTLECEEKPKLFDLAILKRIIRIALPSTLQQCFVSLGNILIQSIVNGFEGAVVAGYAAAIKVNGFTTTTISTLGTGVSNFTAQNLGAGKPDRVRRGMKSGLGLMCAVALVFSLVYVIFRTPLIGLFMKEKGSAALDVGCEFLLIVAPFYILVAIKLCADSVFRGAGAMTLFMATTFTALFLRVLLAFPFSRFWGSTGIWLAWPVSWMMSCSLSVIFYFSGVWKKAHL